MTELDKQTDSISRNTIPVIAATEATSHNKTLLLIQSIDTRSTVLS